jgi:hypothetical protein
MQDVIEPETDFARECSVEWNRFWAMRQLISLMSAVLDLNAQMTYPA